MINETTSAPKCGNNEPDAAQMKISLQAAEEMNALAAIKAKKDAETIAALEAKNKELEAANLTAKNQPSGGSEPKVFGRMSRRI
jgi:hypothetical protein